jgi:hypothetical protein
MLSQAASPVAPLRLRPVSTALAKLRDWLLSLPLASTRPSAAQQLEALDVLLDVPDLSLFLFLDCFFLVLELSCAAEPPLPLPLLPVAELPEPLVPLPLVMPLPAPLPPLMPLEPLPPLLPLAPLVLEPLEPLPDGSELVPLLEPPVEPREPDCPLVPAPLPDCPLDPPDWPAAMPLLLPLPLLPVDCPPAEPLPVPDCVPVPLALPPLPVWPLVVPPVPPLVLPPVCATAAALITTAVINAASLVFMFAPKWVTRALIFSHCRADRSRRGACGGVGFEEPALQANAVTISV